MMTLDKLEKRHAELQQEQRTAERQVQRIIGALLLLSELIKECRECDKANEVEISNKAS